MQLDSTKQTIK